MKRMIGYHCEVMPLSECEQWAGELHSNYMIFAGKHGVLV